MRRRIIFILFCFVLGLLSAAIAEVAPVQPSKIGGLEPFRKEDRVLIMAPHPDDETIGCAGIIQQALSAGAKVKVAYLTNGEHNQLAFIVYEKRIVIRRGAFIHMGEVRRLEAIKAMKLLGLNENDLVFLGYPDFGTFNMFTQYWHSNKPYKDFLTRISSVPYKENFSYGAKYFPENILSDLKKALVEYKPNKIFVSHPADANVDHKTFYLFLQVALSDLKNEIPKPKVYSYLIHKVGWPLPRHYHPELSLEPPRQFSDSQIQWLSLGLTKEQLDKKHQAILCYKSQTQSSAFYLLAFARKNELFGDYPEVELKPQATLSEKTAQFSGSSDMYSDPGVGIVSDLESKAEDKGNASYAVVDSSLLIRVEKEKELNRTFSLQLYLFGYNHRIPFASMPKIRLILKFNRFKIFDGKRMIKPQGASLILEPHVLILRLPLQVLGSPDFILTSMKSYRQDLPVDATGFRRIEISR